MCIGRRCCHSHTVVMLCVSPNSAQDTTNTLIDVSMWDMKTWKRCTHALSICAITHVPPLPLYPFINDDINLCCAVLWRECIERMYQIRFFTISFQFITHDMTHWAEISYLKTENLPHRIALALEAWKLIKCRNNHRTKVEHLTDDGAVRTDHSDFWHGENRLFSFFSSKYR